MALNVRAIARPASSRVSFSVPMLAIAAVAMAALALPLLFASPANLTSDESLYLAESYNIAHGKGLTYPSGEPITHRAPLHPLILAPAVRAFGPDGAHGVSKAIVIVNVALVAVLAAAIAGRTAGAIAGVTVAASSYVNGLGTTLYLDPLLCTLTIVAMLALLRAVETRQMRWFIAAGAAMGLAFLVKESAVEWLPLGFLAWLALPSLRNRAGGRGAVAFTVAMCSVMAPWFAWVLVQDGSIYMAGTVSAPKLVLSAVAALALVAFAGANESSRARDLAARVRRCAGPAAIAAFVAWSGAMLYALTAYSTWPYPNDYATTLPDYLTKIAPEAQPYLLLVLAWFGVVWLAARRDEKARLLIVVAALYAPFAIFAANRGLQLRDALPVVYLSYVSLGVAGAWAIERGREFIAEPVPRAALAGLALVAGAVFCAQQLLDFRSDNAQASSIGVRYDSWDSSFVRESADWLKANLPSGSRVLSSRLYFSSLYVDGDGRFEVRQLPTIRVDVQPGEPGMLVPASNLFRWGDDDDVRAQQAGDGWLYLKQFPGKRYWVALSQQELLGYIVAHEIDYVVLTGDDVAFSSLQLALYMSSHPAFRLLHHEAATMGDQLFVYAVDRSALRPIDAPLAITPADLRALRAQSGMNDAQIAAGIGTPLRVTDLDFGLSERELGSALLARDVSP